MSDTTISISYVDRWRRGYREPGEPLTADAAQVRHELGELYTVVLSTPTGPAAFAELNLRLGYVGVFFLDHQRRLHTEHVFGSTGDDPRLFLQDVVHRTYSDDSDEPSTVVEMRFGHDGTAEVTEHDIASGTAQHATSSVDPDTLWEEVPAFGDYWSIVRYER